MSQLKKMFFPRFLVFHVAKLVLCELQNLDIEGHTKILIIWRISTGARPGAPMRAQEQRAQGRTVLKRTMKPKTKTDPLQKLIVRVKDEDELSPKVISYKDERRRRSLG